MVHSGIVKVNGNKVYHPYVSNSRVHDQIFVKSALEEMIESIDGLNDSTTMVIESDNALCNTNRQDTFITCNSCPIKPTKL